MAYCKSRSHALVTAIAMMGASAMAEITTSIDARKITIEAIQTTVAAQFGLSAVELREKGNSRSIVVPRQIAMYLARQLTEASLPLLGRRFGGRHHTTVMHAIRKIAEQSRSDRDLAAVLEVLRNSLHEASSESPQQIP